MRRKLEVADPEHGDRQIIAEVWGERSHEPVFFLHGSPGWAHGPNLSHNTLAMMGIRGFSYSRPGYDESTRVEHRQVSLEADNVRAIADAYDLESFSIVARSGAGPGALGCAALLGERVSRVALLGAPAPPTLMEAALYTEDMASTNAEVHTQGRDDIAGMIENMGSLAAKVMVRPEYLLDEHLASDLTASDQYILRAVNIRSALLDAYRACEGGGWVDDVYALHHPDGWGFELEDVKCPVWIFNAPDDRFTTTAHADVLAKHLRYSKVTVGAVGTGHFVAFDQVTQAAKWCRDKAELSEISNSGLYPWPTLGRR